MSQSGAKIPDGAPEPEIDDDDYDDMDDAIGAYHDEHSWEQLQEDEFGNLQAVGETSDQMARRRRLLSASAGARVRRGMIRYVQLVVDLSRAAGLTDMRPVRSVVMFAAVKRFVRSFFDENPLSQLGLIVLRNGVAERLTELSSSPAIHIDRLKASLDTGGAASVQNGLDMTVESLSRIPPYGHREAIFLLAALSTCDPGNILASIKAAKAAKVRVSVVGLAAEVHVCRVAASETGGSYAVATGDGDIEEQLLRHAVPPPAAPGSSGVSLVRMGFPSKSSEAAGAAAFVGAECVLRAGSFVCPRCKARLADLPAECHVCGLTLVMSTHLARSYHHLFPAKAYEEVVQEQAAELPKGCGRGADFALPSVAGSLYCYGCACSLEAPATAGRRPGIAAQPPVLQCPDCRRVFCLDCDVYVHEHLHSCPGCEALPVQQQEKNPKK